ncbi:MAG TPA: hypothetical protein VFA78_04490 [Chloroflexota bacterium]|nr:hypothetical protein [Chloroflexota bacterium]
MSVVQAPSAITEIEERLHKGVQFLFELESRGETVGEYERWLDHWLDLLERYEEIQAA